MPVLFDEPFGAQRHNFIAFRNRKCFLIYIYLFRLTRRSWFDVRQSLCLIMCTRTKFQQSIQVYTAIKMPKKTTKALGKEYKIRWTNINHGSFNGSSAAFTSSSTSNLTTSSFFTSTTVSDCTASFSDVTGSGALKTGTGFSDSSLTM
jgi:hypothetical protein